MEMSEGSKFGREEKKNFELSGQMQDLNKAGPKV